MKTPRVLVGAALLVLALLAFVAPVGAQTAVAPGSAASGGIAAVTTIPADPPADAKVQGATAVAPAGALPYTGGDSLPMVQIGVALLVAGGLVTFAVRKRSAAVAA